jgi:hypothetical protein
MSFWYFLFVMLVLVPLIIVWLGCVIDVISRTDVKLVQKFLWGLFMLVVPIIGIAVYLITRPKEVIATETGIYDEAYLGGQGIHTSARDGADVLARTYYGSPPPPRY